MKTLIIGAGEVGRALDAVLSETYDVVMIDKDQEVADRDFEIMHICFPYSEKFKRAVSEYLITYNPNYVVIHSTVPIGTTASFNSPKFLHSPIRGKHPDLAPSLKVFTKYIGYEFEVAAKNLNKYFQKAGIPSMPIHGSKNTEAGKILSTTKYGWDIVFNKEVKRLCEEYGLDFWIVYSHFTRTYNEGYKKIDTREMFQRPILDYMEGPIGGHCVLQNCDLLEDFVTDLVKTMNKINQKKDLRKKLNEDSLRKA